MCRLSLFILCQYEFQVGELVIVLNFHKRSASSFLISIIVFFYLGLHVHLNVELV